MRLLDVFHVLHVFHQVRGRTNLVPGWRFFKKLEQKNKFPPPLYMYIDKNTSWKTNLAKSPAKMDLVGSDDSFP